MARIFKNEGFLHLGSVRPSETVRLIKHAEINEKECKLSGIIPFIQLSRMYKA